eukprot:507561_1
MKPNDNKTHSTGYGRIIYQIDRFSPNQLKATHSLYIANPDVATSNWPIYLFGDNDIDHSRPPNTEREMIGGLAGVTGKYDRTIAFGITTTFYAYKPMPNYTQFVDMMNKQFDELWNKYILNGHSVVIPTPNTNDLKQHFTSFHDQINNEKYEQIIFHNIGTGIAQLPLSYLKYIQYKIDHAAKSSAQHNNELCVDDMKLMQISSNNDQKEDKTMDFCANDMIEVCVNPEIDVWMDAVFLGYMDEKKCFVEVIKDKHNDNHLISGFDVRYVRFKKEEEDGKYADDDDDDDDKLNATDEWEGVSDFVLKEYIRDVSDELSSDLLNSLDEFMRRMQFLGVYSAKSRSRALAILEGMKNEAKSLELVHKLESEEKEENVQYERRISSADDAFVAAEVAQRLADGHTLEVFDCFRCNTKQEYGGIELRNCSHCICYKCFPQLVSSHIAMKMLPTCLQCGSAIHQTDIKVHVNARTAEIVSDIQIKEMMSKQKDLHKCFDAQCNGCIIIEDKYMKEFRCPVCNKRNCIKCKKIHNGNEQCYVPPPPKPRRIHNAGNYHITNEEFVGNWVNVKDIKYSDMVQAFDVAFDCDEWKKVVTHVRDPAKRKIERIQRIQNAKVWRKYWAYCQKLKQQRSVKVEVGGFWHGTRTHKPDLIWKHNGFLKAKSRIGNCLWFATENTYSMNGFQHVISSSKHQVFLSFVCCGDTNHVKFIRSNKILNVYHDDATYPAYLLTYKN